ncbi:MAG: FAD:protein FMN transferase [Flavobacteriales bacterium]|nr:FAD:protein FMN transferase [Flavobacteriales bacterium]
MKNIFSLFLILLMSCSSNESTRKMVSNFGYAQGTSYSIKYMMSKDKDYHHQIDSLFTAIDASLSTYLPTSLISQLNEGDTTLLLDKHFVKVFNASKEVSEKTEGLFDCTVAPLVSIWGFGTEAAADEVDTLKILKIVEQIGYEKLSMKGDSLLSNPEGITLDFNALAQGYTVDLIAAFLESKNISDYLIEVGGEIRVGGLNSREKKWVIGIDKPSKDIDQSDRFQLKLNLTNKSLATSGNYRKFYEKNNQIYSHTIHPKTGFPVQHALLSATVIADDCMSADAYATAFMVMGVNETKKFLKSDSTLEAFLIYTNDDKQWEMWSTEGFEEMVVK